MEPPKKPYKRTVLLQRPVLVTLVLGRVIHPSYPLGFGKEWSYGSLQRLYSRITEKFPYLSDLFIPYEQPTSFIIQTKLSLGDAVPPVANWPEANARPRHPSARFVLVLLGGGCVDLVV